MVERIPQAFIDDLIDRSDITEIIGKRIEMKKAGKEYKACCPFHNEKTPSFTISPEKGFYHCFGCGAHGTSLGFLMDYEKLTFVEAIEELAKILGMEVPKSNEDIKLTKKQTSLKSLLNQVSEYFQSNLKSSEKTIGYLKNRGIDGKTAKDFCIGYSKDSWDDITKKFGSTEKNIDQLLSEKIKSLTDHLKEHHKDFISRRGLLTMVGKRRNLLNYIRNKDETRYSDLIKSLGLRR